MECLNVLDGCCVVEPHFGNRVVSSRAAAAAVRELVDSAKREVAAS